MQQYQLNILMNIFRKSSSPSKRFVIMLGLSATRKEMFKKIAKPSPKR